MVVGHPLQRGLQGRDGRLGLLRVAAELLRQVGRLGLAQGQELTQGGSIALVELAHVQSGVAGTLDLVGGAVEVEHELGGHDTDQHQHDQADTFLAIVGAMHEAHAHRRDHQHQAVPERWMFFVVELAALLRRLVHLRQGAPPLQADQHQCCNGEASHGRDHQRHGDVDRLLPVDAVTERDVVDQGIGQTYTEDRADQRVRARRRDAEVPGAQVPGDGRGQQREDHGQAVPGVDIDQQLDRQQVNDGVGHPHAAQQHAEEVEDPGEEHSQVWRHGFGIDDGGYRVGGVMKAIDELEGEHEGQGEQQAHQHPGIQSAE